MRGPQAVRGERARPDGGEAGRAAEQPWAQGAAGAEAGGRVRGPHGQVGAAAQHVYSIIARARWRCHAGHDVARVQWYSNMGCAALTTCVLACCGRHVIQEKGKSQRAGEPVAATESKST